MPKEKFVDPTRILSSRFVIAFSLNGVGRDMRDDLVELTKAGFGLPESPRLWYLQYKEVIEGLTLKELALLPGLFRSFGGEGGTKLRAMASIHVDDTRYAGDDMSGELWRELRKTLRFGKLRKATDGWVKFCGRWERQNPETFEMEYSMDDYAQGIPFVKPRGSRVSAHEDSPEDHVAPTPSTPALSTTTASATASLPSTTSSSVTTASAGADRGRTQAAVQHRGTAQLGSGTMPLRLGLRVFLGAAAGRGREGFRDQVDQLGSEARQRACPFQSSTPWPRAGGHSVSFCK